MNITCKLILCFILTFSANSGSSQVIQVDDFDRSSVGEFPIKWEMRGVKAKQEYLVSQDSVGNNYLSAKSLNSDMFILKKLKIDLVEYPYFNWSWRAIDLPLYGDESIREFCDTPASIAIVLKLSKWRPRSIKYTWSSTLECGLVTKSPFAIWPSRTDIIVLKSGKNKGKNWQMEKRNVLKDYLSLYDKKEIKSLTIEAIVIMTDSDNTKSMSSADYRSMFFSKH